MQLGFAGGGHCSGTAVAPQVIITAKHCMLEQRTNAPLMSSLYAGGEAVTISKIIPAKYDQVFVIITGTTFKHIARMNFTPLPQGEEVYMFGYPANLGSMFRRGYYMGLSEYTQIFDMPDWHGDSGSGVFNSRGELVAVISGSRVWNEIELDKKGQVENFWLFSPTTTEVVQFTRSQWYTAGFNPQ